MKEKASKNLRRFIVSVGFIICLLHSDLITGQCANWEWARVATDGGSGGGEGMAVCNDSAGDIYITGSFELTPITFGSYTLPNAGSTDIYIAKYNSAGTVLWAKSIGGSSDETGYSICTDNYGYIYVTGFFYSPSISFDSYTLTNNGITNIFIAKYDPLGNVVWAKSAGGSIQDLSYSVTSDNSGNIYLSGSMYSPSMIMGTDTLINSDASGNSSDLFIAKYSSASGNVLWAKSMGENSIDEALSISATAAGNLFITGYFLSPSVTFGSYTVNNSDPTGNTWDLFVAKYNSAGNALWAKSVGGPGYDYGAYIYADDSENAYVTGSFNDTVLNFGGHILTNMNNSGHSDDAFIAKYDPSGNVIWVKSGGGTNADLGYSVCKDLFGNIYVTGSFFSSSIVFDSDTITPPPPLPGPYDPMFILKYDPSGNISCATYLNTGGDDRSGISVDKWGNAYVTGDIYTNPSIIGNDTFYPTSSENVFLAKLKSGGSIGVTELVKKPTLTVFPNPSTGEFNFSGLEKESTIEIYDITGRLVYKVVSGSDAQTIRLAGADQGVYFYKVVAANQNIKEGKIILIQ
ncbi:MAG: hypothetical protein JWO09_2542 [Bacteroidetes bacterium]|nr:hypothetical protein [Bacteroidota bacterium]